MTSRFQQIRTWLATQDGPRTTGEIATGIGAKHSRVLTAALGNMLRDGWLIRTLDGTRRVYSLTEKRPRRKATAQQLAERRRKTEIARNRAKGIRPRDEWLAERKRQAAERREQRAREVAQRREQRAAATAARKAARAAVKKPVHDRRPKPHVVVKVVPLPPPRKEAPRETVEQWMARTGKEPQVLPIGAVSKPLGIGDFNGRMGKAA